jgi:hypothetical protein
VTTLDRLIADLADAVAPNVPGVEGLGLKVTDVDLVVPLESMSDPREVVLVSIPRGLLETGFQRPLGELRLSFRENLP